MAIAVLKGAGNVTSAAATTATNTLTVPRPANAVVGDVLIAVVASDYAAAIVTDTPEWVKISTPRAGSTRDVAVFHAFAATALPPAPIFRQAGTAAARLTGSVHRVTGASQSVRASGAGGWAATADTANTTGMTIPATGATGAGLTVAVAYNNTNAAQGATSAATFGGTAADFQLTSYGSGAAGSSSATSQAIRFSTTPGPFTLAWGKTVANSQGTAVTIPAADGAAVPEPEVPAEVPNTPDVTGLAIQTGPWNISTATNDLAGVRAVTVEPPRNTKVGDILLAAVTHQYTTGITSPNGWQLISTERPSGSAARQIQVYAFRVLTLPVSPPTFTIMAATEGRIAAALMRLTGASTTELVGAAGVWPDTSPDNVAGLTLPAVAGPANSLKLAVVYTNSSAGSAAATATVAGATQIARVVAQATAAASTALHVFTSTTGTAKTVTFDAAVPSAAGFQLYFRPYAPPAPASWEARVNVNGTMVPAVLEGIQSAGRTRQAIGTAGWKRKAYTVEDLVSTTPFFIAHRGSGDSWPEHTFQAYTNATAYGIKALELSVNTSSDGVMFCHHDTNLLKMTGLADKVIADMTWAEIEALYFNARQWLGEGADLVHPVRTEDVLNAYASTHVIFIEDKQGTNATGLLNLMDKYPADRERFVWKQYAGANQWEAAKNRGYKVWGYFMADTFARIAELAPRFDLLGVPHTASDAVIAEVVAAGANLGKPVICWEVHYRSMLKRLLELGVQGMMCSNVPYVYSTATAQSRVDTFATGRRAHGDLPHATDSWPLQPRIIPGEGILSFNMRQSVGYVMGSMCPIPGDSYTIEFSMRYAGDTAPAAQNHAGLWFGHDLDKPHRSGSADSVGGYHLILRGNGSFDLMRHDPGTTAGIPLSSAATPPPVLDQWMTFRVSVSPGLISAERVGVPDAVVESTDAGFRGGYFGFQKNYSTAVDVPFPFTEFRNISWETSEPGALGGA